MIDLMFNHRKLIGLGLMGLVAIGAYLYSPTSLDQVEDLMRANVIAGSIVYFVYTIVSIVIVPLPVIPLWPLVIHLYGIWLALALTLVATWTGALIAFYLARIYGRPLVIKVVGKPTFSQIEDIVQVHSLKTFLTIRFLVNNYFDSICYVAGLSKLSLKHYIIATGTASSFWLVLLFFWIERAGGLENLTNILVLLTGYAVFVLVGGLAWKYYQKTRS